MVFKEMQLRFQGQDFMPKLPKVQRIESRKARIKVKVLKPSDKRISRLEKFLTDKELAIQLKLKSCEFLNVEDLAPVEDSTLDIISDDLERGNNRVFKRLRMAVSIDLVPLDEKGELDEGVRERLAKHGIRSDLLYIT